MKDRHTMYYWSIPDGRATLLQILRKLFARLTYSDVTIHDLYTGFYNSMMSTYWAARARPPMLNIAQLQAILRTDCRIYKDVNKSAMLWNLTPTGKIMFTNIMANTSTSSRSSTSKSTDTVF